MLVSSSTFISFLSMCDGHHIISHNARIDIALKNYKEYRSQTLILSYKNTFEYKTKKEPFRFCQGLYISDNKTGEMSLCDRFISSLMSAYTKFLLMMVPMRAMHVPVIQFFLRRGSYLQNFPNKMQVVTGKWMIKIHFNTII